MADEAEEFAAPFRDIPNISMPSYGEIHIGVLAMTSTMLLSK